MKATDNIIFHSIGKPTKLESYTMREGEWIKKWNDGSQQNLYLKDFLIISCVEITIWLRGPVMDNMYKTKNLPCHWHLKKIIFLSCVGNSIGNSAKITRFTLKMNNVL